MMTSGKAQVKHRKRSFFRMDHCPCTRWVVVTEQLCLPGMTLPSTPYLYTVTKGSIVFGRLLLQEPVV